MRFILNKPFFYWTFHIKITANYFKKLNFKPLTNKTTFIIMRIHENSKP